MKQVIGGGVGAAILVSGLFAAPAWSGPAGAETPGLGPVIYREGDVEVFGSGPDTLALGLGVFDAFKANPASAEARLEYRWGRKLLFLGPMLGLLANTDGGIYGYGGIYFDFRIGPLVFTPAGGIGGYRQGDSKHLGGTFPFFHAGLDVSTVLASGLRLSIACEATDGDQTARVDDRRAA